MAFREGPFGDLKVPLAWVAAVALIVAGVVAAALLLSDRRETFQTEAYGVTRKAVDTVAKPVGGFLAAPGRWTGQGLEWAGSYFFAASENRRLKDELIEARKWQDAYVALKDRTERLEAMVGVKTQPEVPMATGHVVLDVRGPFANSRLADVGRDKGVKVGNPVMSERGLVGRVVGVSSHASRVLLLTDVASRTPVMIDRTNARAILTGDGGPNPKLEYLRGRDPVKNGDRVLTSGDGGVLPRGLPVGTAVKGLDGRWRVVLDSDSAPIDFVRVLKFEDFSQVADQQELSASVMPSVMTEDPDAAPKPAATPAPGPAQ